MEKQTIQPRILRASQAPAYLGMSRDVFNKAVRPFVHEFPIGKRGVGFDRCELDRWADAYIAAHAVDKKSTKTAPKLIGPPSASKAEFQKLITELLGKRRRE